MASVVPPEPEPAPEQQVFDDLRASPEYACAWDLELWRATQQRRIERQLRDAERKALDALKLKVTELERDERARVERRSRELAAREEELKRRADALDRRRGALDAEAAELRRERERLAEAAKRAHRECEERVERARDEYAHRLELQAAQTKHHEQEAARATARAAQHQRDYTALWDEFSAFKARAVGAGANEVAARFEGLRAQHQAETQLERERHERAVAEERAKGETLAHALRGQVMALTAELAAARQKLAQAATRHSHGRHHPASAASNAAAVSSRTAPAPAPAAALATTCPTGPSPHQPQQHRPQQQSDDTAVHAALGQLAEERERVLEQRAMLLREGAGAYTEASPVILALAQRARTLELQMHDIQRGR